MEQYSDSYDCGSWIDAWDGLAALWSAERRVAHSSEQYDAWKKKDVENVQVIPEVQQPRNQKQGRRSSEHWKRISKRE